MKRALTLLLLIVLFSKGMNAQFVDFDSSTPINQYIFIDTSQSNNIWQIGQPQKALFDTAFSFNKVIVTDTLNFYPTNNNSSFYFSAPYYLQFETIISFYYKMSTDSLADFGTINARFITWDTTFNIIESFPWTIVDLSSQVISSYPDTLPFTGNTMDWLHFECHIPAGLFFYDSVVFEFNFETDSIQNNKEGWMIDDLDATGVLVGMAPVSDNTIRPNVFPNPFVDNVSFIMPGRNECGFEIAIYDLSNRLLDVITTKEHIATFNLSYYKSGVYFYLIEDKSNNTQYFGKLIKY
jgi:hypothetical protein